MKAWIPQPVRDVGQALVEFALAGTLIFTLLSASVDLGMIFFIQQALGNAVQEGALFASTNYHDYFNNGKDYETNKAAFFQAIRTRTSHEAGEQGGIGFIRLRDLNSNGVNDDVEGTIDELIPVSLVSKISCQSEEEPGCSCQTGTGGISDNCFARVKIHAIYEIQFPLAPVFKEHVWLHSNYIVPLDDSGFSQFESNFNVTPEIWTVTPTPSIEGMPTETPTPSPTATPIPVCSNGTGSYLSDNVVSGGWQETDVGRTIGEGSVTDSDGPVKLCAVGYSIDSFDDNFLFVSQQRANEDGENIAFVAKLTDFAKPDKGLSTSTKTGILIRTSNEAGSPFVMVAYWPYYKKVIYQYRDEYGKSVKEGDTASVSAPSSSNPVWLRLMRTSNRIYASYATSSSKPDMNSSAWKDLNDRKDDKWLEINHLGSNALFGVGIASGYEPNPVNTPDFAEKFAKSTFSEVAFEAMPDVQLDFEVPTDDRQPIEDRADTNFEISISGVDITDVAETQFRLYDPDGVLATLDVDAPQSDLLRYDDFAPCFFGGSAGSCEPMGEEEYGRLSDRGNDRWYVLEAEVWYLGAPYTIQRRFRLNPMSIEWVDPDPSNPRSGETYNSDDPSAKVLGERLHTRFELEAFDPKYGRDNTDGIGAALFRIYDPDGDSTDLNVTVSDTDDKICTYGMDGSDCAPMPEDDYATLLSGARYRIIARAESAGGSEWTEWLPSRHFQTEPMVITFENPDPADPDGDNNEIQNRDETAFKLADAYVPHIGTTTGDGIEKVEFQIIDPMGALLYSSEDTAAPYCVFGDDGSTCNTMPTEDENPGTTIDYFRLVGGTYKLSARGVQADSGGHTSRWYEQEFTVPDLNIDIKFVDKSGSQITNPDLGIITDREAKMYFEVQAKEEGSSSNGSGIEQVEIMLLDSDGNEVEIDGSAQKVNDTTAPYYLYDSADNIMPLDIYSKLKAGDYTVRARAQDPVSKRWSQNVELTFTIPSVYMTFIDPDYNNPKEYQDANDKKQTETYDGAIKVIKDRENTAFEICACDPRYNGGSNDCNEAEQKCVNRPDDIDNYEFFITDPNDKEVTELSSGVTAHTGDRICAFGESGSECKQMEEDLYRTLQSGTYKIEAWVQNKSEWVTPKIAAEFRVEQPRIMVKMYDEDEDNDERLLTDNSAETDDPKGELLDELDVYTVDDDDITLDDTKFWVEVWTPHIVKGDDDPTNGAGIRKVEFEIDLPGDEDDVEDELGADTIDMGSFEETDENGLEGSYQQFCVFLYNPDDYGSSDEGSDCELLYEDDSTYTAQQKFQRAPSGTYEVIIKVTTLSGETYEKQVDLFKIPEVYMDFTFFHTDRLTTGQLTTTAMVDATTLVTEAVQTDIEIAVSDPSFASGLKSNRENSGEGVSAIEYELWKGNFDLSTAFISKTEEYISSAALPKSFCPFGEKAIPGSGESTTSCNPLSQMTFDGLEKGRDYTIKVRAQQEDEPYRWTEWKERSFQVPMPTPTPTVPITDTTPTSPTARYMPAPERSMR
jgi:hypothetical protein